MADENVPEADDQDVDEDEEEEDPMALEAAPSSHAGSATKNKKAALKESVSQAEEVAS